jgi:hypothetical protein
LNLVALLPLSSLGQASNLGLEMINFADHPRVTGVAQAGEGTFLPVYAPSLEFSLSRVRAAHQAFRMCLQHTDRAALLREEHLQEGHRREVAFTLCREICTDPRLPAIYAEHRGADVTYLKALLHTPAEHGR